MKMDQIEEKTIEIGFIVNGKKAEKKVLVIYLQNLQIVELQMAYVHHFKNANIF